jgi:hypothetical protein
VPFPLSLQKQEFENTIKKRVSWIALIKLVKNSEKQDFATVFPPYLKRKYFRGQYVNQKLSLLRIN